MKMKFFFLSGFKQQVFYLQLGNWSDVTVSSIFVIIFTVKQLFGSMPLVFIGWTQMEPRHINSFMEYINRYYGPVYTR